MPGRLSLALALALGASALTGCTWTLITAADAAGSLVQAGFSVASNYSSPTSVTGEPASLQSVCIELNQTVATGDFVPNLQVSLQRRGVNSTVYNPGTSPPGCEAMLVYAATTSWDKHAFSSNPVSYLSAIDLTLLRRGQILVTARYETNDLSMDRFASARQKLDALVGRMVVAQAP
ncbi:hypothetical protein QCE63_19020 [Caballeronia sp. LZ065]|uniref:hypothetical protein n=1 Tax=Caballeronia sp. LZ065 TaxID=3038571 RepID=UPI00285EF06E|nr:hypothetical protein [Caballeronia sp. LZ065]MDR5781495.1 hypothetical protein [Caballeronia sp. LZ065]